MDGDDAPTTSISADAFRAGQNFCLLQEQFVIRHCWNLKAIYLIMNILIAEH